MSLTNEQIKSILDDAPKNATEIYRDEYISSDTDREGYLQHGVYAKQRHSLSDLAEILALRERVADLERIKLEWEQVVQPAYDYVDKSGIGELGKSKLGCLIESHEKLQAKIEAVRLEQGNELVIREVWHIVEPETMEQGK
jgi:hypothetical protein